VGQLAELLIAEAGTAGQHRPGWATALFAVALVIVAATVALMFCVKARHVKRRIFWVGLLTADGCAAVSALPLGMDTTVTFFVGIALVIVFRAYYDTPYLKIGGRIYALHLSDSRPDPPRDGSPAEPMPPPPPDSYQEATAQTVWWVFTVLIGSVAVSVYLRGWFSWAILSTALFSALAVIGGIDDATRKLPMARGQHVQAFVMSVASILLCFAPPICYFVGYQIGKRKPMGKGKHAAPPHDTQCPES
jgi:hypothetical protein